MEATEILSAEHRVIERVLASLEEAARQVDRGEKVRLGFFSDAADFVKGFADGCHHRKEEGVLFPAMEAAGIPRDGGPIGVMLMEHQDGRDFTAGMRRAAQRMEAGDQSAKGDLVRNALGYVMLLRQHILKEDQVLFPMADHAIPSHQQSAVSAAFDRIEHEETGEGVHEKYLALAEKLEREMEG